MIVRPTLLILPLAASLAAPASAQRSASAPGDARVVGTWSLVLEKSRFSPGPTPTSQIRSYEAQNGGYRATIKTTFADRPSTYIDYVANYDSLEYPVMGSADYDTIRLKKVDEFTSEAILGHAGRVIATTRRVIAPDGQTMTITFKADDIKGKPVNNVMVFARQK